MKPLPVNPHKRKTSHPPRRRRWRRPREGHPCKSRWALGPERLPPPGGSPVKVRRRPAPGSAPGVGATPPAALGPHNFPSTGLLPFCCRFLGTRRLASPWRGRGAETRLPREPAARGDALAAARRTPAEGPRSHRLGAPWPALPSAARSQAGRVGAALPGPSAEAEVETLPGCLVLVPTARRQQWSDKKDKVGE